jgi:hypothetical protein
MQNEELSPPAIVALRIVPTDMDLPEQKGPRLLGFSLGEKIIPMKRRIDCPDVTSPRARGCLFTSKAGYEFFQKHTTSGEK